jgi:WD40 repeat protein
MLVGGGRDGVVYVWDAGATPIKCIARLQGGHANAVCSVEMLQDERLLSASIDGKVSIWDGEWTRQRRATARCNLLKEDLMAAAWNPERGGAEWRILQECMAE